MGSKGEFFIGGILILLFQPVNAISSDEPDFSKEDKFHQIYNTYNATPTEEGKWNQALKDRKSQVYKVNSGDSLWDISETLFGDGFYWSKVWSLNPYIKNPHEVQSGAEIRFFPGSGLQSPTVAVNTKGNEATKESGAEKNSIKQVPVGENGETPSTTKHYTPLLDPLPRSFPSWVFNARTTDIKISRKESIDRDAQLTLSYYAGEGVGGSLGAIQEMELDSEMAGEGDFLFVKATSQLQLNHVYLVSKELGNLVDPDEKMENVKIIQIQGLIKILRQVEGLYKAIVVRSIAPIEVNSVVSDQSFTRVTRKPTQAQASAPMAKIMGAEKSAERNLIGDQEFVFVNKGSNEGLALNQSYAVFANQTVHNKSASIVNNPKKVAQIKIIKLDPQYATAIVTNSWGELQPGDFLGANEPAMGRNEAIQFIKAEFGSDLGGSSSNEESSPEATTAKPNADTHKSGSDFMMDLPEDLPDPDIQ